MRRSARLVRMRHPAPVLWMRHPAPLAMNVEGFAAERGGAWTELEGLISRAHRHLERLAPDEVLRAGGLYRSVAADLAVARRRYPGDPVVRRLEQLVTRARPLVYAGSARRQTLRAFFARDYWQRVAERPRLLLLAAVFLFVPAIVGGLWAHGDPSHAAGVVPGISSAVVVKRQATRNLGRAATSGPAISSQIFTNNIRVTFLTFAGGILFGLGSALVLVYNGAFLGIVAGLATASGNAKFLAQFVTAHGVLELSCITVAGAAGLRLGLALISPGYRPRGEVLVEEGRKTVEIVLGTMPWLVVAGLVEGFITPAALGFGVVLPVGLGLGATYWGLVIWRGRRPVIPALAPSL